MSEHAGPDGTLPVEKELCCWMSVLNWFEQDGQQSLRRNASVHRATVVKRNQKWLDASVLMINNESCENHGDARDAAGGGWGHKSVDGR